MNPVSPEIVTAIRSILLVAGGWIIGKGWVDAAGWDTLASAIVILLTTAYGIYSKRPSSPEALQVAQNVNATRPASEVMPTLVAASTPQPVPPPPPTVNDLLKANVTPQANVLPKP